jgi:queuosine precursor transporter
MFTARAISWTLGYIATIVLVNWLFIAAVPGVTEWQTGWGTVYLANLVVGAVFVVRDYTQREIGHRVLLAMLFAGLVTGWFAGKDLAIASVTAFVISETVDWFIYSFWKKSLQSRILVSSLVAIPLDTFVFQNLAGYYSPAAFTMEVLSKAIGVFVIWQLLKLREPSSPATA